MINASSRSPLNSNSNRSSKAVGEPQLKRQRGKLRKYGPNGCRGLSLLPFSVTAHVAGSVGTKRGRGRPPGSGRKQQLASLGEFGSIAGMGFIPHLITIAAGEDIAAKIYLLSEQGSKAISILSASGVITPVTLRSGNPSIVIQHKPRGSCYWWHCWRLLRAATSVHMVVGSFIYGGMKMKKAIKTDQESSSHEQEPPISDYQSTTLSSLLGRWPVSRQMDMRNLLDIDLTRG